MALLLGCVVSLSLLQPTTCSFQVTVHGLDLSPLVRHFGPYAGIAIQINAIKSKSSVHECDSMFLAGPGIVVAICVLIMLYAYALSNRRGLDNLMYAAILFCGAGGYVLGALAGNSPRTTLIPSHPPMEDALSSSSQSPWICRWYTSPARVFLLLCSGLCHPCPVSRFYLLSRTTQTLPHSIGAGDIGWRVFLGLLGLSALIALLIQIPSCSSSEDNAYEPAITSEMVLGANQA